MSSRCLLWGPETVRVVSARFVGIVTSSVFVGFAFCSLFGIRIVVADDWSQWRGPARTDRSAETGLLQSWPGDGLEASWVFDKAGLGYSGFSIIGDRLYTMGVEEQQEFALCLNSVNGQEIWRTNVGKRFRNGWGDGPRSTPTIDADQVFVLSATGTLACLHSADGKILWQREMNELGGTIPTWGYSESPLVDGKYVYCTPGGDQGAIAAFDRTTGKTIWQCRELKNVAHYSSIIVADHNNERQLIQLLHDKVVGLAAQTGKILWQTRWPGEVAVIPTPIFKDGVVYVTSGYGVGSAAYRIGPENKVQELFRNKVMKNHHGGVVELEGKVYGFSDKVGLVCQDLLTGEKRWADRTVKKGAISYADGRFYFVQEDDGKVLLLECTPEGVTVHGQFVLSPQSERRSFQGRIWVHPVIANGRLYLRDQEYVYSFDVRQK